MVYRIVDGEVLVSESATGTTVWRGRPEGLSIEAVLPVPDSDDFIALAPYAEGPTDRAFQNLLRCRWDGTVVWRAELPELGSDAYVSVAWNRDGLQAYSWSGFVVLISPETGRVLSKQFTK